MADFQNLEKEAFLFAEDLFSDIMSLHPMFRVYLPEYSPTPTKSSHFTGAVSKSVMVIWHELRNDLKIKFRRDFNSFSKGDTALKVYLEYLCSIVRKVTTHNIKRILYFSAVLLELIALLYERNYAHFFNTAAIYWLFMFKKIAFDEFYKEGGWEGLRALSKELESDYDNKINEIYWKYFCSMPRAQPDQGSEKGSNSTKALSGIATDFASSTVITSKAELDIVSKDKIGTDFESETPLKDPVIPETPEQTKQFFEEMTPEDKKALDSKEQERKMVIYESPMTLLGKKDAENISLRPEDSSKKATVSESESSMSRSSSAQTDKFSMSGVVKKTDSKSDSIPSTTPKKRILSKIDSVPVHPTARGGRTRATPMQPSLKDVAKASAKVTKSGQALSVKKGATSTVTGASGQNVSQDFDATEPEDLNTSARGRTTKKGAPASGEKQTSAKKRPKSPFNTGPKWKP